MARMSGFVFQDSYIEKVKRLTDQELGRLVRALATYHATGEEQELAGREIVAYDFIRDDIDKADRAYQQKCRNMARGGNDEQLPANDRNCPQLPADAPNKNKNLNKNDVFTPTTTACAREEETPFGTVTIDPLIVKIQRELNGLTDTHYQRLEDYRQFLGDELVAFAIDAAVGNGVRNWSYVEAILRGYEKDGIKSVGEAKARDARRKQEKPQRASGKTLNAQNFSQRDLTEDDLRGTSEAELAALIEQSRKGGQA